MRPYEHFFWSYTLFYRKPWAWKVGVGALLPDLIYIVVFFPKIFSYGSYMEWMHDPLWETVWDSFLARSVHSFLVWGLLFMPLLIIRKREIFSRIYPFSIGWGLHIAFDALTHVNDGYALFYPLSDLRFPTPVSYWEREFYATEYFWIGHSLMIGLFLIWIGWRLKRLIQKKIE